MKKLSLILRYPVSILLFALGAFLRTRELCVMSSAVLFSVTALQAVLFYRESRKLLDLRLWFCIAWLGAISLTALNLSEHQLTWIPKMWFTVGGFYFLTAAAFDIAALFLDGRELVFFKKRAEKPLPSDKMVCDRMFTALLILFGLIMVSFLTECVVFHFEIPILSDKPHAYTEFHISGIHYLVVSTPFVHALSVWILMKGKPGKGRKTALLVMNILAFLIPVMILSKIQLFFELFLPFAVWFLLKKKWSRKKTFIIMGSLLAVFLAGTVAFMFLRKYPDDYLQGIFRFRKRETSLPFQYVYVYVTMNFENLYRLMISLTRFSYGARMAFPFLWVSCLRFLPSVQPLLANEVYTVCPELNTLTLIYDAYGDFGAAGVYVFGIVLGIVLYLVTAQLKKGRAGGTLLYCQMLIYMGLSFFSTWFQTVFVWFYFGITLVVSLWCYRRKGV